MSTTPPLLAYRSPPADSASEFEQQLQTERARWIRKRFLWFCIVNTLFHIAVLFGFEDRDNPSPHAARLFNYLNMAIVVGAYLAAFLHVLRARPALPALLKLGLYLTAILPCLSIAFMRVEVALNRPAYDFIATKIPPGAIWALMSPWSMLLGFTVACLFIPWTLREALRPAAVILLANTLVVATDLIFTIPGGRLGRVVLAHLAASPLAVLPGLLTCWWRFSRFRERYRLVFESTGYRALQLELAGARRLHESSLPPRDYHTTGPVRLAYVYEPMRHIGGDILYVHPERDPDAPRLSVVLIDVNGHGIGAALMANRVIGETQRLYAENPDAAPHQILAALNRYVRLTMARDGVYATALVLRLDTATDTLEFANGGHPPAFVRRARDGQLTRLDSDTYLLGVHDGDDYCPISQRIPFAPGDALLAYTDGATEAKNPAGEMLTIKGLHHLLAQLADDQSPDRWPQSLLNLVITHRRSPPEDDTLLVTLHRA